jgi:hypothetical protein
MVTIPLAPRTVRAIDLATGERAGGPLSSRRTVGVWTTRPAVKVECRTGEVISPFVTDQCGSCTASS